MKSLLDFLGEVIKLLTLQSSAPTSKEDEKTTKDAKDAYAWLMSEIENKNSTRVQQVKQPYLEPGKIYVFKYTPLYKNELDYWDQHPIVLALGNVQGANGKNCLGLNISWYPPEARKFIVEQIRKMYAASYKAAIVKSSNKAIEQKSVVMDLYNLKTALDTLGFSFALRQYIPSRMQTPKVCICYEDWDKAVKLDQPKIFPELQINNPYYSLQNIYESFKLHVQYQRDNRGEARLKRDAAKMKGKYKFDN
jgi:hypothetical protein